MWSSWPHAVFHGQYYTTGLVYIRCTITQLTYFIRYGHPTFKSYDYSNKLSFQVTKIDKVVTYQEVLSLLNSHDIKLVTGQINKIISPLSQDLWPLNLAGCWLQREGLECKRVSRHRLLVYFCEKCVRV